MKMTLFIRKLLMKISLMSGFASDLVPNPLGNISRLVEDHYGILLLTLIGSAAGLVTTFVISAIRGDFRDWNF